MALFGNVSDDYTKTGKGALTKWSNRFSWMPYIRNIPLLGTTITGVLGFADTILEAGGWLLQGKIGSAATVAIAGTVGTAVNAIGATPFWWANAASGVATGETLGTHARALTESIIGGVSGALGSKPQVLRSYPAGIGGLRGAEASGIGRRDGFVAAEASRRGQSADDAWARMQSNQADHLADLEASRARAANAQMGV